MEAAGIVAEYNPFHNGHMYHVRETRRLTGLPVVAVMSGSMMQRGEPAFLDKWTRSRLAVENGVDLVLELPAAFSLRSAEFFARGACGVLQAAGCVTVLSCGAETPGRDFRELARRMLLPQSSQQLRALMKQGHSYASACSLLLTGFGAGLSSPNDILALEYSKALLDTDMGQIFVKRREAGYNDADISGAIASATAVRGAYGSGACWKQAVPEGTAAAMEKGAGYDEALLWQLCRCRLLLLTPAQIAERCQCSEGLENILKSAASCPTAAEMLHLCSRKRYPASRIRRLLLQLLFDRPRSWWEQREPAYIRVLAFNDTGRLLLREIKKKAQLPVITKLGRSPFRDRSEAFRQQLELELAASDIAELVSKSGAPVFSRDYLASPAYIKKPV